MWTVVIVGVAAVNFAVGNSVVGALMCVLAAIVAAANEVMPSSDEEDKEDD